MTEEVIFMSLRQNCCWIPHFWTPDHTFRTPLMCNQFLLICPNAGSHPGNHKISGGSVGLTIVRPEIQVYSLNFVKEFMHAESQRKKIVFSLTEMLMALKVSVYKNGQPKSCCETRGIDIQKAGAETNINFSISGMLSAALKARSKLCISN